jgi:hypothetical protein
MESSNQKSVVVLGAARSGTSVTAGLLEALGVNMGALGASRKWNPKGSFEDKDFQRLNRHIFAMTGDSRNYWNPPSPSEILDLHSAVAPRIQALIERKSAELRLWGWKTPTTCLTVELFLPYLTKPYLITVLRNPLATAKSAITHTKGRIDLIQSLGLVNFYTGEVLNSIERHSEIPNLFVSFESIVANPRAEAYRVAEFLGLDPSQDQMTRVDQLVIPRERIDTAKKTAKLIERLPKFLRRRFSAGRP